MISNKKFGKISQLLCLTDFDRKVTEIRHSECHKFKLLNKNFDQSPKSVCISKHCCNFKSCIPEHKISSSDRISVDRIRAESVWPNSKSSPAVQHYVGVQLLGEPSIWVSLGRLPGILTLQISGDDVLSINYYHTNFNQKLALTLTFSC